jgi:stage IV sporulation protein B
MPKARKFSIKKLVGCLLTAAVLTHNTSAPVRNFFSLPEELSLQQGQKQELNMGLPLPLAATDTDVLRISSESLGVRAWQRGNIVELVPQSCGDSQIRLTLFGIVPVKNIHVTVTPQKMLIPGGESIGVSMYTEGTLVVGRSEVTIEGDQKVNPARDADLRPGDVILKLNDVVIESSSQLAELIAQYGQTTLKLEVLREGQTMSIFIKPVLDREDNKLRLGIWVRDSTAGVGTLSFYDPATGRFGALGHPITDVDTGTLLSVKDGEIVHSKIIDVKQGEKGTPGELRGFFPGDSLVIGKIDKNTKFGIYGSAYGKIPNPLYQNPVPVAPQAAVHTGPATILTTVDDGGIKEFTCNIIKITRQSEPAAKGMVLEITDKELIDKTGGIVQGMSGSPILQDGCIIGAVTHVFISDPTKGHGIFIDWMLANADPDS